MDERDEIRIRISSPGDEIRIRIGKFVYESGLRIRISSPAGDEIRPPVKIRRGGGHVLSSPRGKETERKIDGTLWPPPDS